MSKRGTQCLPFWDNPCGGVWEGHTWSDRSAAGVLGRGEYAAVLTRSKPTLRTRSTVRWNWSSVSPGNPTMASPLTDASGMYRRMLSMILAYRSAVYPLLHRRCHCSGSCKAQAHAKCSGLCHCSKPPTVPANVVCDSRGPVCQKPPPVHT
jgi:hypothetical protein